jgi:hypothetical protein
MVLDNFYKKKESVSDVYEMNKQLYEINQFTFFLHFLVYMISTLFMLQIYQTTLFVISFSIGYQYIQPIPFLKIIYHPYWFKKTYQIAFPQLIQTLHHIMILKTDYSFIFSIFLTFCIHYFIYFQFHKKETDISVNVRMMWSMIIFVCKFFFFMILQ